MSLLLMMLTTMTAWAAGDIYVGYLDPTAPIGMQRKTVLNPVWVDDNTVEIGTAGKTTWYFVSGTITKNTRIEVKGTVNLILADGCNFTVSKGIHVPSSSALNIYAQSVANRGSLTATATDHNAAIGGNGGEDVADYDVNGKATNGESSGKIAIYGGIITTTNGNIGGGDGGNGEAVPSYGGNGGDGDVTIYSGIVTTGNSPGKCNSIGGGMCGYGYIDENQLGTENSGKDGRGTVTLSWADASDRIYSYYYYTDGGVTFSKSFVDDSGNSVEDVFLVNKTIKPAGTSYTVSIGSMPDGVTATADLVIDGENKYAVEGQVVTVGFSGVPDGKVPVVSATYGNNYEVFDVKDNGDGTFSFTMPDGNATVTASELKNDIKSCEATVPNQSLGTNSYINYKFWDAPATIGETVTDGNTTLTLGTDYQFGRITYADLTNHSEFDMPDHVGDECLVEIKGIGNYGGSKYVRFDIVNPSGSGTWGSLSWALSNGTLTISGDGPMVTPQGNGSYPWLTYKSYIETITIEEDVTSVADGAFATEWNDYHYAVSTVNLPSSLTSIGANAFAYCTRATITIPTGVTSIGSNAFLEVSKVIGSLNDNADNATLISLIHEAKRADVTISGRTLKKDGSWNSLCLPFDVDGFDDTPLHGATVLELDVDGYYDDNNKRYTKEGDKYFEGQTEYTGETSGFHQTGIDGNTLRIYFNPVTSIEAGKPYLVKWEGSSDPVENPEFTGVKVWNYATDTKAATSKDGKVKFVGSYNPYASTGSAFLKESGDASALNAFRAFVKVNSVATLYSNQECTEEATILQTGNSMVYYVKNTCVLTEANGVTELCSTWSGLNNVPVSFTRSFNAGKASTICLPFPMTSIEGGTMYEFVGVTYDNTDGWVATMVDATPGPGNEVTSTTANIPYLFMPTTTGEVTFTGTIASVPASITAESTTSTDWTFNGTYSKLTYSDDLNGQHIFGFAASATAAGANNNANQDEVEAGEFVKAISGAYFPAFRAYLKYTGSETSLTQARGTRGGETGIPETITVRLIGKSGEIDGIGEIRLSTGEVTFDPNAWYDLNGRKLAEKPTQRGIYINNGHKVAIK